MSDESSSLRDWSDYLLAEFFQTERSAIEHCHKEAERLGGEVPPAKSMEQVCEHAQHCLEALKALTSKHKNKGEVAGDAFSFLREMVGDNLLTYEQSYRGTLLGMTHGMDMVETLHGVSGELGDRDLEALCKRWLSERRPLVETCRRVSVSWFVAHPEEASAYIKQGLLAKTVRKISPPHS